jgi:uncharacterized protein YdeI (YjbR/CyaY-like superfamily)
MRDDRVDAYIQRAAPFAQPILTHIRKMVHAACPDAIETVKWQHPQFEYKGPMMGMAAFKQYCVLGFWKSKLLVAQGLPVPDGENPMGYNDRLTSVRDLPSDRDLTKIIKAAMALNDAGIKVPRPKTAPKPPVKPPAYFLAALKKSKKAHAAWAAFSPSHQREYVEWVTEAKTDETRERRLTQAVEWMAEGKSRNWKYERP